MEMKNFSKMSNAERFDSVSEGLRYALFALPCLPTECKNCLWNKLCTNITESIEIADNIKKVYNK